MWAHTEIILQDLCVDNVVLRPSHLWSAPPSTLWMVDVLQKSKSHVRREQRSPKGRVTPSPAAHRACEPRAVASGILAQNSKSRAMCFGNQAHKGARHADNNLSRRPVPSQQWLWKLRLCELMVLMFAPGAKSSELLLGAL